MYDARREYTKNVWKAARDCYRKFATDLLDIKAMANFNKMTKAVPRDDVGVMRRDTGEFTTSTEESLEVVMASAFPESQPVLPHHQNAIRLQNETLGPFMFPEMSFLKTETIEAAFKPFKNSKSPGPDKFKPRMLKQLPPVALGKLKQ